MSNQLQVCVWSKIDHIIVKVGTLQKLISLIFLAKKQEFQRIDPIQHVRSSNWYVAHNA